MDEPQHLAAFLTQQLQGYAELVGPTLNSSNSHCMAEGDEEFELNLYLTPPRTLEQLIAEFYSTQKLETKLRPGCIQIAREGGVNIGFVVFTGPRATEVVSYYRLGGCDMNPTPHNQRARSPSPAACAFFKIEMFPR